VSYAPFDVVVVPFPFSDRLAEKRRPAVVVSVPALEAHHGWVWLAMITSTHNANGYADVVVVDRAAAGLPAPSAMRAGKLATVEPDRILRRIGSLAEADRRALVLALKSCAAF
jgi:mRNA interferase MazF